MPYLKIETNQMLDDETAQTLASKTSAFIAELIGKPEQWVMVAIDSGVPMAYAGNNEATGFVELKSIGLPEDRCAAFSQALCEFLNTELLIAQNRIYIEFKDISRSLFGWNGDTL